TGPPRLGATDPPLTRATTLRSGGLGLRAKLDAARGRSLEPELEARDHLDDRTEFSGADRLGHGHGERGRAVAEVAQVKRVHRRQRSDPVFDREEARERMDRCDDNLDLSD